LKTATRAPADLRPQLKYQGKIERCLPHYSFPDDWHATSTPSHWPNEDTTRNYIEKIILPYLSKKRNELKLPDNHRALMIFDNFKAQCTETILRLLDDNYISVQLIPPNCTDRLLPLDISVNKAAKEFLCNEFHRMAATRNSTETTSGLALKCG